MSETEEKRLRDTYRNIRTKGTYIERERDRQKRTVTGRDKNKNRKTNRDGMDR